MHHEKYDGRMLDAQPLRIRNERELRILAHMARVQAHLNGS
jgi:hypothetical protein